MPYPFQWGRPTFNAGETFAMMAASLVSLFEVFFTPETSRYFQNSYTKLQTQLEILSLNYELVVENSSFVVYFHNLQSTGTFYATARYGSATPVPPSVIGRGVGWLVGFLYNLSSYAICFLISFHYRLIILLFLIFRVLGLYLMACSVL